MTARPRRPWLEKLLCMVGLHDWSAWTILGRALTMLGSGLSGIFCPDEDRGKWIDEGDIVQNRRCIRPNCGLEQRRKIKVRR